MAQRTLPITSALGFELGAAAEGLEIAERIVANEDHISAPAPVAAVGSPARNVGFATEAQAAVAAGAGQ